MLLQIMEGFGQATGLILNTEKSSVAAIRCQDADLQEILQDFAGQRANFPLAYLGLPLHLGRLRLVHLQPILDRARNRMAGWQGRLLTPAGRRELVRSVLSSLPVYLLTALKVPKQFYKEFDKARRRFLWAGDQELNGGKCKVGWPRVSRPVKHGGLGIIDLEKFSRALRLRWLWYAWSAPDRPWVGMELPVDSTDMALFAAATKVQLGNGRKASFWASTWLDGQAPAALFPLLFAHSKRKNRTVAEALQDDRWIRDIVHNLTHELLADYFRLWSMIDQMNYSLTSELEDQITWTRTANGEYTAHSAYLLQFEGSVVSNFPKLVRKPWAPGRCKFFLWLLLQNRLWTADRLQRRGWVNNYFCPLCERSLETAHHLFLECPFTLSIWNRIATWSRSCHVQPSNWSNSNSVSEWLSVLVEKSKIPKGIHTLVILVLWAVWKERNQRVFHQKETTIAGVVSIIQDEAKMWCMAGAKSLSALVDTQIGE
ncbi:unnamed protein product [Urochloa humidicola]